MKKMALTFAIVALALTGCGPSIMHRSQIHFGLSNWIAQAAKEGSLNVVFYNIDSVQERRSILNAMDGHNKGPVVTLRESSDTVKGTRIVVVKDPGFEVYGDHVCSAPDAGFTVEKHDNSRYAFAICQSDLAYGNLVAQTFSGQLNPEHRDFDVFFSNAFSYLTDTYQEDLDRAECSNGISCT